MNANHFNILSSKIVFLMLTILPVGGGFVYAFLYSIGTIGILNNGFTLTHWVNVLTDTSFWFSLGYSFYIAIVSVGLSILLALTIVLFWKKNLLSNNSIVSYLLYIPLCFPAIVVALFSFQVWSKSGLISRIVSHLGILTEITSFPDLTNDTYGFSILYSCILMITPFFAILFSNLYKQEQIDHLKNIAMSLGATKTQALFKIVLPVILKKAKITISLFIVFVMSSYEIPLLLGRQNPQMISVLAIQKLQRFNLNDIPQAYAIACLYMIFIGLVLYFLFFSKSSTQLSVSPLKRNFDD